MTAVHAIANRRGTVKHIGVWHHHATGPSPLCGQQSAKTLFDEKGDRRASVVFEADPRDIDLPWCSRCELTVEHMVRAISLRIPAVSR